MKEIWDRVDAAEKKLEHVRLSDLNLTVSELRSLNTFLTYGYGEGPDNDTILEIVENIIKRAKL